jgi:hypothetical protein
MHSKPCHKGLNRWSLKHVLTPLLLLAAACVSGPVSMPSDTAIPVAWVSVPVAARFGSITLADDGSVTTAVGRQPARLVDGPIHIVATGAGSTLMNGDKVLAGALGPIDSLDLSESRGEVAFSAGTAHGYDIGLVSSDGGDVHWMPSDPADEVAVQWAPRGNKISYVIRAGGGDVVRTLHIPTSYQFAIPFAEGTVHAVAWDAKAERFAVAWSTPDASDRVDVVKYDGAERRTAIAPERQLPVDVEPVAPGAIVLRPRDVRYGEKLPVVVWVARDFAWSDERAALLTNARVAVIVTKHAPDSSLWSAAEAVGWLDLSRAYVVGATVGAADDRPGTVVITGDPALAAGRSARRGNVVTVPSAVVQSFAAGYIAAQLERDPTKNGSSR